VAALKRERRSSGINFALLCMKPQQQRGALAQIAVT